MNKLKKINYFLLAITALFFIAACEKDLYEEAINQNKEINIKQISLEKFNSKMRQMKNKPDIERFMVSSKNSSLQSRTESTSGFEIVTSDIKEITQGDYTSYTMYLKTPDTTSNIYNITIEEIDGYSSFFITKYIPTTYWLENKDQPFDGEIITYRESNTNSSGANTLQEYLDLINGELYAGGAGGGGSLSLTGTSGGTSWSTGLGGSPIYPHNCNGTVKTDYILEPRACASGDHMPGQSCEYLNPSYPQYNLSNGPYYQSTPYYTCVPNTTSNGNTTSTGNTAGGNTLGGGGSGSGTGIGSGGTSTSAVTGSITTIVDPTEEKKTPCDKIKNVTSGINYKTKFKDLNTQTNYNKTHETGFFLVGNDYVDGTPHPTKNTILIPNNSKNGTHIHNKIIKTYTGTTINYDSSIKMLSVGDLEGLIKHLQPHNTDPKDTFVVMASSEGIFSISILESIPWNAELEAKLKEFENYYKKRAKHIVENYTIMTALQRKNYLEKMFLQGLKDKGLEDKIGLFEGEVENETDPNINNYNIKWTRKTLKKVFLGYNVQESPCE